MALTDSLAGTAAQTIPVYAFAAIVEIKFYADKVIQLDKETTSEEGPQKPFIRQSVMFMWHSAAFTAFAYVMLEETVALLVATEKLRGVNITMPSPGAFVENTIFHSQLLLIVIPVIVLLATVSRRIFFGGWKDIWRMRAKKKTQEAAAKYNRELDEALKPTADGAPKVLAFDQPGFGQPVEAGTLYTDERAEQVFNDYVDDKPGHPRFLVLSPSDLDKLLDAPDEPAIAEGQTGTPNAGKPQRRRGRHKRK